MDASDICEEMQRFTERNEESENGLSFELRRRQEVRPHTNYILLYFYFPEARGSAWFGGWVEELSRVWFCLRVRFSRHASFPTEAI